jgi:lysophospholipase L1-like esterase
MISARVLAVCLAASAATCELYCRSMATAASASDALTILQIGDSHTAADFFTGQVRRTLQARYGQGGVGYMPAGKPKGFRSALLDINVSKGWTYESLQSRDANPSDFSFSGYNVVAVGSGKSITIKPHHELEFDSIEIEAMAQSGAGAIDVKVNGQVRIHRNLDGPVSEPVLIKITAPSPPTALQEISITTEGKGTVSLGSISIYNDRAGLTYDSVGYLGATINILNKLEPDRFAAALHRINPRIIVLSFGTNEAASETLDVASYSEKYERVVRGILAALPNATIVLVAPPDFNQISPASCRRSKRADLICRPPSDDNSTTKETRCAWYTPTKLDQVREAQRKIAERHGFTYWNWASIMPAECGAHKWFKETPPLMSPDHVHFTAAGYRKGADQFVSVLAPIIDKVRAGSDAISHH